MPKIELTDEQSAGLRDLLESEIQFITDTTADDFVNADAIQARHLGGVYADILHLLEIA
jgi:hypothetical protein